jgi:hypothetical protein
MTGIRSATLLSISLSSETSLFRDRASENTWSRWQLYDTLPFGGKTDHELPKVPSKCEEDGQQL